MVGGIYSPNWQYIPLIYHLYTTYILPAGGLYATYHLLGEPETTIECVFTARPLFQVASSQEGLQLPHEYIYMFVLIVSIIL